jgi:hypothetical protein
MTETPVGTKPVNIGQNSAAPPDKGKKMRGTAPPFYSQKSRSHDFAGGGYNKQSKLHYQSTTSSMLREEKRREKRHQKLEGVAAVLVNNEEIAGSLVSTLHAPTAKVGREPVASQMKLQGDKFSDGIVPTGHHMAGVLPAGASSEKNLLEKLKRKLQKKKKQADRKWNKKRREKLSVTAAGVEELMSLAHTYENYAALHDAEKKWHSRFVNNRKE